MPRSALSSLVLGLALAVAPAACGSSHGGMNGPSINNHMGPPATPAVSPVVSQDILAREPIANHTRVKHILIGWKDLGEAYPSGMDPRAAQRSKHDAEALVESLLGQLKAGGDFDALMKEHSEDPGSAVSGEPYAVSPDAGLVIEFKQIGLRLNVDEIGVVESSFGFHIVKRIE